MRKFLTALISAALVVGVFGNTAVYAYDFPSDLNKWTQQDWAAYYQYVIEYQLKEIERIQKENSEKEKEKKEKDKKEKERKKKEEKKKQEELTFPAPDNGNFTPGGQREQDPPVQNPPPIGQNGQNPPPPNGNGQGGPGGGNPPPPR